MPNRKLIFLKNHFYHIFSRGNRKAEIFTQQRDYERFLEKIEKYRKKYSVEIIAYCLLPNHFHLLAKQTNDVPLTSFVGTLLNSYARYRSVKYQLPPGHVFQGRFGCKLIENENGLIQTSRYIHLNPIKERLLSLDFTQKKPKSFKTLLLRRRLRSYPWSSYSIYLGQKNSTVIIYLKPILDIEKSSERYQKFVESKITFEDIENLENL